MLGGPPGDVCSGAAGRRPLPDGRPDERAPPAGGDGQRAEVVAEQRRRLAALGPAASAPSLPLCRQPAGGAVRAGGLDAAGSASLSDCLTFTQVCGIKYTS